MSNPRRRNKTLRRTLTISILGLAALLGFLLRGCFGIGLGPGDGQGDPSVDATAEPEVVDATVLPERCQLRLDSDGLSLDGEPIDVEDAVRTCRQASDVELRVTGAARSGTYDDVQRAFEEAGIRLELHQSNVK